ncbi:MAG: glutamine synthetase [Hyphomicrobiales bacterium]|nr:glutamine synthetase [Hyphomicrobiales bacterium]
MDTRQVKSGGDLKKLVEERGMSHVKVGVFDVDGVLRGKYMAKGKFFSALEKGFGFCDVVLGWDSYDQLYENPGVKYTGWHTGYPDAPVRLLPEMTRELPLEDNMIFVLGEFCDEAEKLCPRGILRKVIERASAMGFETMAGLEYEFFVFDETPNSVREKHYRDMTPMAPGYFGYSFIRATTGADFYRGLLDMCQVMDIPIEGLHEETGPGALEAAIEVASALEAADRAALFKTFTKIFAQRQEKMATFMAKWSPDWPGQSGHIHMSLWKGGKSVFHDAKAEHKMSETMRHFIGGQQALMPELLCMTASTINAYTRMIPGFWAPTDASWGIDNRTCALRIVPGSEKSQRVEYRIGPADANPYLALAAALGSGLWGVEHKIEPGTPVQGNAYDINFPDEYKLPATLWDAAQRLRKSKAAEELFGGDFVDHYATSREWEEREFRKAITDWEMERYFEII